MSGNKFLQSISDFDNLTRSQVMPSNCVAITFINKGSNTVVVNGLHIAANDSFEIAQPTGFLDRTKYEVNFLADGTASHCVVVRVLPKNQS